MIPDEFPTKMLVPMFDGATVTVIRRALSPPGPAAPEIVVAVTVPPAPPEDAQPSELPGLGRGLGKRFL